MSDRVCHLQFHIRSISTTMLPLARGQLAGQSLLFPLTRDHKRAESRVAIAMNTTLNLNPARYSIVALADHSLNLLDRKENIHHLNHSFNKKFVGITVFQFAIMDILVEANAQWVTFLDCVEIELEEVCYPCSGISNHILANLDAF